MSEPFLGEIKMVGFNFAPVGYALCDGQILPISQNQALFSLLGTTYGGNGTTNFGLPNLQGRMPMHFGSNGIASHTQGQSAGVETVTLTQNQMPTHTHLVNCDGQATGRGGSTFASGAGDTPVGNYPALAASPSHAVYSGSHNNTMNATMLSTAGGSAAFQVLPPYLVVNFIIALQGIFPARN